MDHFMEEVVVQKNHTVNDILYIISWILLVLTGAFALLELSSLLSIIGSGVSITQYWPDIIMILICGGMAATLFLRNDRLKTEYEYTFTNGALDFAMVFNNKKRKNLGTLNVRNVDAFGKVASEQFQRYITMKDVKQDRWFLNRGSELYYFYFQKDNNKRLIVIEPSEELVKNIQHYLPQGVGRIM